jgi:hypothetical protein
MSDIGIIGNGDDIETITSNLGSCIRPDQQTICRVIKHRAECRTGKVYCIVANGLWHIDVLAIEYYEYVARTIPRCGRLFPAGEPRHDQMLANTSIGKQMSFNFDRGKAIGGAAEARKTFL